jgi:two-component system nitrate/nitrite response regulator NarL
MRRVPRNGTKLGRQTRPVRVLLVSDVRLYREALARWCNRHAAVQMVGADGHGDGVVAAARAGRPDIALIDMRTAESGELAHALAVAVPGVRLVGLGLSETEENVLAYAGAGFAGYVARETPLAQLVAVLRGIGRGEVRYSRRITASLLQRLVTVTGPNGREARLTVRESEIVQLIDEGLSNREIARRLAIGVATVKNHVHNVLEKLHVHRRGEAAARLRHPQPVALDLKI